MKNIFQRIFLVNWPRKLVAFISAIVIWFLVNQSVTVTKTFSNIPVRIINLPAHKTVSGLTNAQFLNKRISLTLTGEKEAIEELDSSEIEVMINVEGKEESFIAKIDKKNLTLSSREESIKNRISDVSSNDIFIKISNLVTQEIPLTITNPKGNPPAGFQFLDISPKHLLQKVSGAEEDVLELKKQGLILTFDLNQISKEELETIKSVQAGFKSDEISFFVPASWKKVYIPFQSTEEPLNDPRSQYLRIDFLKKELLELEFDLPILLFYPEKNIETYNPRTISFEKSSLIKEKNGLFFLNMPLCVGGISHNFLNVIKDHMVLVLTIDSKEKLNWSIVFIDEKNIESAFLSTLDKKESMYTEEVLKERFHHYVQSMQLYTKQEEPLQMVFTIQNDKIIIK